MLARRRPLTSTGDRGAADVRKYVIAIFAGLAVACGYLDHLDRRRAATRPPLEVSPAGQGRIQVIPLPGEIGQ